MPFAKSLIKPEPPLSSPLSAMTLASGATPTTTEERRSAFRLLFIYVDTKGRCRNGAVCGVSLVSPLPVVRRYRVTELRRG